MDRITETKSQKITKKVFDMGPKTQEIFRGKSESVTVKEIYGESAEFFARLIRSRLPINRSYSLIDIGSAKGELLQDILKLLPEYSFEVIATDTNSSALSENLVENKIVADAELLPFPDQAIDLGIMRYILQFNSLESQERIVKEICRIVKEFVIVQHGGADNDNTEEWRQVIDKIFLDNRLQEINRVGMFWSSAKEIEDFMDKNHIRYERIQSRKIDGLSQVYVEKYLLNSEQGTYLKKIMEGKDYIIQTTWIIYPNRK